MNKFDTLANRVKYLIDINNLSVTAAAKKCAIPQPRLNDIVSGKTLSPHQKNIKKIAEGFDVPEWWVAAGDGPPPGKVKMEGPQFQVTTIHQAVRSDQQEWLDAYEQLSPGLKLDLLAVVKALSEGEKPPGNLQRLIPQDIAEAWLTATDEGRRGARLILTSSAERSRGKGNGGSD